MLDILAITTPIYLVIAVGYMLVRVGFIKPVFVEALGQFAIRVSLSFIPVSATLYLIRVLI